MLSNIHRIVKGFSEPTIRPGGRVQKSNFGDISSSLKGGFTATRTRNMHLAMNQESNNTTGGDQSVEPDEVTPIERLDKNIDELDDIIPLGKVPLLLTDEAKRIVKNSQPIIEEIIREIKSSQGDE